MKIQDFFAKHKNQILSDPKIVNVNILRDFVDAKNLEEITIRRFVKKSHQLDEAIRSQIQRKWRRSIRLGVIAVLILLLRLNKIPSTDRGIDSHDSLFEVNASLFHHSAQYMEGIFPLCKWGRVLYNM